MARGLATLTDTPSRTGSRSDTACVDSRLTSPLDGDTSGTSSRERSKCDHGQIWLQRVKQIH